MHANHSQQIDHVEAGDIAVVIGLKSSQTGDTLGVEAFPILLEKMHFPEPVISVAIEPKTLSERKKLSEVLEVLALEDPTFSVKENEETGELIISGMGELHLDVLVTRIFREFKVEARVGKPQVSYRETISAEVTHVEKYHRMIAGKEHSATITDQGEAPAARPGQLASAPRLAGERAPRGAGGRRGARRDRRIRLRGRLRLPRAGHRSRSSSMPSTTRPPRRRSPSRRQAPWHSTRACRKASPILLEPIMAVDVLSPSEFIGEVIGNLNARQGLILHVESKPGADHVKAQAPLVSMFGYSTALRSATQGRATFTMEFSHFAEKVGGFGAHVGHSGIRASEQAVWRRSLKALADFVDKNGVTD